jgi:LuxR family maltose regulon positive regulatory protein
MNADKMVDRATSLPPPAAGVGRRAGRRRAPPALASFNAAKMSRPQMLRAQIHRDRLSATLDGATTVPVTLVCAGAGWGKTVLASEWAGSRPFPVAWLTLDRGDNDAQAFWSYVVTALRAAGALAPDNPLAELPCVPADDIERVRCMARGLRRLNAPTALVIDDFHEIDDPTVLRELQRLLDYPPPDFHLILISRSEPPLPLHRLRVAGTLTEIRAGDLAFTFAEAAELLSRHALVLAEPEVTALLERTEGWPVGLQLAAAFLTGPGGPRPVADFTGDLRPVDEYLANEVLAGLPPKLLRFLLATSICDHVCGELADAMTLDPELDGQRTLEQLELVNDFVVRLGAKPRWFRYHHLLRDVLRHRLLLEGATILSELHGRAARWHAAHGSVFDAIGHAVAGRDWPYVGQLMVSQATPLVLSTNRAALMRALRGLPPAALDTTAELMVCGAVLLFEAGDWDALPGWTARARDLMRDRPEAERMPVEINLRLLELSMHRVLGDMPAVVAETTALLTALSRVRLTEVPSAAQYRASVLANKGIGLLWQGRTGPAERFLWAGSTAARATGVEFVEIDAVGHLALLEIMLGSVQEAARLAGTARELAERRGGVYALQSVAAHLAMVLVQLERNELTQAERALQQARRAHRSEPEAAQRLLWWGSQARLALALDQPTRARAALAEAHLHQDGGMWTPALDRWLLLGEAQVDLATGRPAEVEKRYARLARDGPLTYAEQVCRARAAFDQGDLERAEGLLAVPPDLMSETVASVEAHLLTALIADTRRCPGRAADALSGAFALAERERIHRPFIALGGSRLDSLIGRHSLLTHRNTEFVAEVLRRMAAAGKSTPAPARGSVLSGRETEVLRYLPTMLTAGEIAAELGVSVNTVKAHMRSIYRKLDVARRREAVTSAHEQGLF